MAGHLALAGHQVTVYNRSAEKRDAWRKEFTGSAAATPREAVAAANWCSAAPQRRRPALGQREQGAFAGMKSGTVFVDHTTASANVARELAAEAGARRLQFVDAPAWRPVGAQNGMLTNMCGGEQAAFDAARPVAMAFSRAFTLLGGSGAGQLSKMVNQIAIAGWCRGCRKPSPSA